jgi:hypothetical protein
MFENDRLIEKIMDIVCKSERDSKKYDGDFEVYGK